MLLGVYWGEGFDYFVCYQRPVFPSFSKGVLMKRLFQVPACFFLNHIVVFMVPEAFGERGSPFSKGSKAYMFPALVHVG